MTATGRRTRTRRRRKRWSWSTGEYGEKVCVFAERNGRLYGQIRGRRVALKSTPESRAGWPDTPEHRTRAKAWAREQHKQLQEEAVTVGDPSPTVAKVFATYLVAQQDREKSATSRRQDDRCAALFTRVLGAKRDLSRVTLGEWQGFVHARLTGALDGWGNQIPEPTGERQPGEPEQPKRRPVRARTVEVDCTWVLKVCNWALAWEDRDTGRPLMREHPFNRARFRDAVPHEQNPRRPVATQDRFEAILAVAGQVHPFLAPLLSIVNGTGRRISAVLQLRFADLRLARSKAAPHGAIQWPGETDKMGKAWAAPINAAVRGALDAVLAERPGVGTAFVFPAPKNPAKSVDRWLASKWLEVAERLAEVPKQEGSLWHAYRRKWGTERKHLPIQDVAQAGGWRTHAVLEMIYQQPDEATLYRVVSEPAELRGAKG